MGGEQPTDEVTMVANPYRAAVARARSSSVAPADRLEDVLSRARRAMDAGAWTGSGADAFSAELDGHRETARSAGPAALAAFDAALARLPETVPDNSWYVHWRNLGPR